MKFHPSLVRVEQLLVAGRLAGVARRGRGGPVAGGAAGHHHAVHHRTDWEEQQQEEEEEDEEGHGSLRDATWKSCRRSCRQSTTTTTTGWAFPRPILG